ASFSRSASDTRRNAAASAGVRTSSKRAGRPPGAPFPSSPPAVSSAATAAKAESLSCAIGHLPTKGRGEPVVPAFNLSQPPVYRDATSIPVWVPVGRHRLRRRLQQAPLQHLAGPVELWLPGDLRVAVLHAVAHLLQRVAGHVRALVARAGNTRHRMIPVL